MPRFGATYDVFGNGRTAAKFFLGKYLTTVNTVDEWLNYSPAGFGRFVAQTTRPWNDATFGLGDTRSGNFRPDCDLLNTAANGECGPMANPNFAKIPPESPSRSIRRSQTDGIRAEHSWDLNLALVQEIFPRVSVEVGYFRRPGETRWSRSTARSRRRTSMRFNTPCRPTRSCPAAGAMR